MEERNERMDGEKEPASVEERTNCVGRRGIREWKRDDWRGLN